eukprot:TRINITY_DN34475_c0_g1_i2.p1 TRINITY_DN34475_c0_g1~~TRINITY_DN34475_c0_g1_i2.p1  ORF type:complete len:221 (+),score=52.34 TRINITY_DN34475_c0_g1_i2:104-766(+)
MPDRSIPMESSDDVKENGSLGTPPYANARAGLSALLTLLIVGSCFEWALVPLFQWHVILMAVGYIWLMVEGIAAGKSMVRSTAVADRLWWKQAHMAIFSAALAASLGGFGVIYYNKSVANRDHFKSWHGTVGAIAVTCFTLQSLLGYAIYFALPSKLKVPLGTQHKIRKTHSYAAFAAVALGLAALLLGLVSNYAAKRWSAEVRVALGGGIVAAHALALF